MDTSLIIVDDFLPEPHRVRAAALAMDYPVPRGETNYPGLNSAQPLRIAGLEQAVERILGEALVATPETGHGRCRITLAGDRGRGDIHTDRGNWSGVLYLSLPEHCRGGTEFFRHLPTGTDRVPILKHELAAHGCTSFNEMLAATEGAHTNDRSKWQHLMTVPMRFNRLVLLRPWLWHTAGPGFGDRPENGRLVYLLFFESRAALAAGRRRDGEG